jgi:hypothetical protein
MEKYKIMQCLEQLTVSEYRIAVKILPKLIGKSHNTFWNYTRVQTGSKMDLPYTVVVILEKFFKLQPGELSNEQIDSPGYDELIREYRQEGG